MKKTLGRRVITGVGWTFVSSICVRLMQFLVTVILARLLVPGEFGLFALGTMLVTAITLFRDLGLGQALIYHKTDVQKNAETTLLMSAIFGLVAWASIYTLAPLIADIFKNQDLLWPLRVMTLSVIPSSLATVPSSLLEKELEFRKRAMPEFAMGVSYAAVAIVMAFNGFGVWSMVAGHVVSTTLSSIVTWRVAGWKLNVSFNRSSAKRTLGFGKPLMAASVLFMAFFYIDSAAIGRWLGVTALGYYNLAYTICNLPATNITHVVNKVMYPTYSKLNDDIPALREAYFRTVKSISLLSFPVAIWLVLVASDFVIGFFSMKWSPAIILFRVLAFYGMFRSIGATAGSVFMAMGEPKWVYRLNCLQLAIAVPLLYPVTIKYNTFGVAVLFTLAYTIGTSMALWKVVKILDMTVWQYAGMFKFPLVASLVVIGGSYALAFMVLPSGIATAIGSAVVSAILYPLVILRLDAETYGTVRSILSPSANRVYAEESSGKGVETDS